ncbi:AI-2E family transporter [Streptomyces sp. NPDC001380]|uniref:AI-2E family transporter n=1 Tax=Streptomyces sp. NPDC001380 TaxID=3364566 RepID=UPI003677D267
MAGSDEPQQTPGMPQGPGPRQTPGAPGSAPAPERASRWGEAMPRWLPRALLLGFAFAGLFEFADWAFHRLVGLFTMLLVSFFLSLAMEPAVDRMAARGVRRGLGTLVVFLVVLLCMAGFLAALGTLLVDQVGQVARQLPHLLDDLVRRVNATFHTQLTLDELQRRILRDSGDVERYAQQAAGNVWGLSSTLVGGLFRLFTIALFTFYFTADGPRVRRTVCSLLPPSRQAEVLRAWEIALAKTGGYLYSRALLALFSAVAHAALLFALGIPYAAALAVWVGVVSQFVPTIGTYLAGALPILVALTVDPVDALWVLVFVVVYQQVENYLLQPRVTARTVEVHPAVAFGAVVAGAALLGGVGAVIAIPVAATLQGFVSTYVRRYEVAHDPRIDRGEARRLRRLRRAEAARRLRRLVSRRRRGGGGGTGPGAGPGRGGGGDSGGRDGGRDGGGDGSAAGGPDRG